MAFMERLAHKRRARHEEDQKHDQETQRLAHESRQSLIQLWGDMGNDYACAAAVFAFW